MNVNDKRVKHEPKVPFEDLKIGQAYEDREGILCIKTNDADNEDNCICFIDERWEVNLECLSSLVIPLVTTLNIEK